MTFCRSLPPFFMLACLWPGPRGPCRASWDTISPGPNCLGMVASSIQRKSSKRPVKTKHACCCYKGKESNKKYTEKLLFNLVIGKKNWTAQSYLNMSLCYRQQTWFWKWWLHWLPRRSSIKSVVIWFSSKLEDMAVLMFSYTGFVSMNLPYAS